MGVILNAIIENFGFESFTSWDLHLKTGINQKVIQMVLKKMKNNEVMYNNGHIWRLRTQDEITERRIQVNKIIDKYSLPNKKYNV